MDEDEEEELVVKKVEKKKAPVKRSGKPVIKSKEFVGDSESEDAPADRGRSSARRPSTSKSGGSVVTRSQSRKPELEQSIPSGSKSSRSGRTSGKEVSGAKSDMERAKIGPPKGAAKRVPEPDMVIHQRPQKGKGKEKEVEVPKAKTRTRSGPENVDDDLEMEETTPKKRVASSSKRKVQPIEDDEDGEVTESTESKDSSRSRAKKRSKTQVENPGVIRLRGLTEDPRDEDKNWPVEEGDVIIVSVLFID